MKTLVLVTAIPLQDGEDAEEVATRVGDQQAVSVADRDGVQSYEVASCDPMTAAKRATLATAGGRHDHAQVPRDEDRFTNRPPTPEQAAILDEITEVMLRVDALITNRLPDSRYRAAARTKLEECSMWAKKATVFTA